MEHKLQDVEISPIKRGIIRRRRRGIMAKVMDMHNKPAGLEKAIPENDKHENEKLEMQENKA